MLFEGDDI